jgi:hypothetical protein
VGEGEGERWITSIYKEKEGEGKKMAVMCEECKCSIYLEEQADGTKKYGGCENECTCCNTEGEGK